MENTNFQPIFEEEEEKNKHLRITKSEIVLIILIFYFFISIFAAVIYINKAESNVYKLSQLATSNLNKGTKAIDLPVCLPKQNTTALRSSTLENTYSGSIESVDDGLASKSAKFYGSITLRIPGQKLYTYFINKTDQNKINLIDNSKFTEELGTITPLKPNDRIEIKETIRLNSSALDSKSRIEITKN